MTKIKDILQAFAKWAPPSYQESYDNSQLLTGNPSETVSGVLLTLDCTEEVVEEAIKKKCNLIVAHHPIIFGGLKSLTGRNYVERTIIKAIKNDVAILAVHTNLDNVRHGVNNEICERLGLQNRKVLAPKSSQLLKLVTFVPESKSEKILEALHGAGAGNIGNYTHCSFQLSGEGTFKPNAEANPNIGERGQLEKVNERRLEVILPKIRKAEVLQALLESHPYEEVAYYLSELVNTYQDVGSGMIGALKEEMEPLPFLNLLKERMNVNTIRHTALCKNSIKRIAVCGGAGSFLLNKAIAKKADVFISSDFKYHEFFDADKKIIIADIGHYESEQFTKDLFYKFLKEKFSNFALNLSETITNPISYL